MSVWYVWLVPLLFAVVTALVIMRQMRKFSGERAGWKRYEEDPQAQWVGSHVEGHASERPRPGAAEDPSQEQYAKSPNGWSRDGWFEL